MRVLLILVGMMMAMSHALSAGCKPALLTTEAGAGCKPALLPDSVAVIELERPVTDFGAVAPDSLLRDTIWFTNTGNVDLKIKRIYPDCSCVSSPGYTGKVAPGERGFVVVRYRAGRKEGGFRHILKVLSNARERVCRITVRGVVRTEESPVVTTEK